MHFSTKPAAKPGSVEITYTFINMRQPSHKGGAVAAGHRETARIASEILNEGGNAFDAALAAMLTACIAEPILASPGGGGFLTAHPADSSPVVYDFFAQTPSNRSPASAIEFYPIKADFGAAHQIFHIGMGSIATPGFIRGLFSIHRDLCSLPLRTLMEPAISLAKNGILVNNFQSLISQIVSPILHATADSFALNQSPTSPARLIAENELHTNPELADFFQLLISEGEDLFYRGEAGQLIIEASIQNGGHIRKTDLSNYKVIKRQPLQFTYHRSRIVSNPPPSLGGTLIAFALGLLETQTLGQHDPGELMHLRRLAQTICLTQQARSDWAGDLERILAPGSKQQYLRTLKEGGICNRGTTQISVADTHGNLASMTLSNGEGSGYVIPGSGIMLNNMLGEEDLNPDGFQTWPSDRRMASMMAPTLVFLENEDIVVTGSGGSNRIRSAILQVISNLVDFQMPLDVAVSRPRIHFENGLLSLEPGFKTSVANLLADEFPNQQHWDEKNLFFGGTHSVVVSSSGQFSGTGDERRGGIAITI
ncbi:MAG: gamma-glutamyltransferase [Pseudomonadota bacterium]